MNLGCGCESPASLMTRKYRMGNWISALARALWRFRPGSSAQREESSAQREENDAGKPTPEYAIDAHVATDIGCVRETNQDAVALVRPPSNEETKRRGLLAIVADGMGGHKGGAVASALAVETVCQRYFAETGEAPARALELAMQEANRVIYSAAQSNPALEGMGTTATALVIIDQDVIYAHARSRCDLCACWRQPPVSLCARALCTAHRG